MTRTKPTSPITQIATTPTGLASRDYPDDLADGWQPGQPPTAGELSALHGSTGEHLLHLHTTAVRTYSTLLQGIDNTTPGDLFAVLPDAATFDVAPGSAYESQGAALAEDRGGLATDGRYLYHQPRGGTGVVVYSRDGLMAATGETFTTARAASTSTGGGYLYADGQHLIACRESYLVCWRLDDGGAGRGELLWEYERSSTHEPRAVAVHGDRVYVVHHKTNTNDGLATCLDLSDGSVVWEYQHTGGGLHGVATDGIRVFVGGNATTEASGATTRALVASNGYDAANEGGTGQDATGLAWDAQYVFASPTNGWQMFFDGLYVYQPSQASTGTWVRHLPSGPNDGQTATDMPALLYRGGCPIPGGGVLMWGDDYLARYGSDMTLQWSRTLVSPGMTDRPGVADGQGVFILDTQIERVNPGRDAMAPALFRRHDDSKPYTWQEVRQLAIPVSPWR